VSTLRIALEEGFEGEAVVVDVNGSTVLERDDVRTRMQVGFAERLEVPVEEGDAVVEVRLHGAAAGRGRLPDLGAALRLRLTAGGARCGAAGAHRAPTFAVGSWYRSRCSASESRTSVSTLRLRTTRADRVR
jgi:hypothetical protein